MKTNLYLDLHVLQTVPPSCINRDDTNSPKTAVYGGTLRSRVSSQSWKHAMRSMFKEELSNDKIGYRTKNTCELLQREIKSLVGEIDNNQLEELANNILEIGGIKSSGKKDVLFLISSLQIKSLAKIAVDYINEDFKSMDKKSKTSKENEYKERIENALIENPSVDILLFGRMSANNVNLNYDAASQVAHAISTHAINNEYDYFTACDDFSVDDNAGAGHLGIVEYNSATLYRYATVNIGELTNKDKLNVEEIKEIAEVFINTFVKSMPTGKQNTFANRTLPFFVYATIRNDQPINMVGAFERAVKKSVEGYEKESEDALVNTVKSIYENYTAAPLYAYCVGKESNYDIGEKLKYNELVDKVKESLDTEIRKEN